jgi:acetyl esterase/lipase
MATRWAAAGNGAELAVYPGGAHVFQMFDNAQTEACLTRTCTFLAERTA